jgi:hypothetical protein
MEQSHAAYQKEFGHFEDHTDEKDVFAELIGRFIKKHHVHCLLDVGDGDRRFARPIAKKVETYVGVEQDPIFAKRLRRDGLRVLVKSYPAALGRTFDMALISHVLRADNGWKKIIAAVRRDLAPRGYLLIFAHQSHGSEWTKFKKRLGYNLTKEHLIFGRLLAYLRASGVVRVRSVATHLRDRDFDSFLRSLAYAYGDRYDRKRHGFSIRLQKHRPFIRKKYWKNGKYIFPFQHIVITFRKT